MLNNLGLSRSSPYVPQHFRHDSLRHIPAYLRIILMFDRKELKHFDQMSRIKI